MAIPGSFIDELVARSDIFSVVSSYMELKKSGSGYVGLCPFHNEKTPSFRVDTDKQLFHCFGCGVGGGVISFIMKIEHLEFVEAVEKLAQRAGMEMPEGTTDVAERQSRKRYIEMQREAARFYYGVLSKPEGAPALEYFSKRELTVKTIKQFGLGFAPNEWDKLIRSLRSKGYKDEELIEAGLAVKNKNGRVYDRFRNRVMFPIIDIRGDVIGFGGRVMDDSVPKYLNSPETRIFNKRLNLFALNIAKKDASKKIILAEGYMDVISLHQAGFSNAVASLGTALTPDQAKLIKRYADEVFIAYDSDGAGVTATERAISILRSADLRISVIKFRGAKDPDEFIKKYGAEEFKSLIESANSDSEFLLNGEKEKYDLNKDEDRAEYLKKAAVQISKLENPVEADIYISRVASETNVSRDALKSQVELERKKTYRKKRNEENRKSLRPEMYVQPRSNDLKYKNIRSGRAQEGVIAMLSEHPELFDEVDRLGLKEADFDSEYLKKAFVIMKRRYSEGLSTSPASLSGELSEDELSEVSRVVRSMSESYDRKALTDYISVIKVENAYGGSDEEMLSAIKKTKG